VGGRSGVDRVVWGHVVWGHVVWGHVVWARTDAVKFPDGRNPSMPP